MLPCNTSANTIPRAIGAGPLHGIAAAGGGLLRFPRFARLFPEAIALSNRTLQLDDRLYRYLLSVSLREPPVAARLRRAMATHPQGNMQIAPEQGQFMALLVQALQARRALEIGVFTGYSALCVALALPKDGLLVACEIDAGHARTAQRYWRQAKVERKIDLRLAPALDTLEQLQRAGQKESFDFVFIDAHKPEYPAYYEHALRLLRPGGLIAIDNTLWSGRPADSTRRDRDTRAIRKFNRALLQDRRVAISLVPVADGLTLALKPRIRAQPKPRARRG